MTLRQIILDTETTGLKVEEGHRVIEIGCLEMINRKLTGRHFHHYINPEREVEAGALAVHGINNDFLKDKPLFRDIVDQLIEFIRDGELIIHNAPFDVGFLNFELNKAQSRWKEIHTYCQITDTLPLARKLHVGQRNSLDALCKRYGVDTSKREYHGALLDAHLLAQVYLAMTGGQGSFFENSQDTHTATTYHMHFAPLQTIAADHLIIIKADTDELMAHQAYLEQLKQKGKCIWMEDEANV